MISHHYPFRQGFQSRFLLFTDAVSKNRVASDVHSYFKSNFDGKSYEIDLASVQQDLYSAFAKYSKSKGISVDSDTETQKSLLELSTIATQTYRDNVEFPFLKELSSVKKTYDKYLFVAAGSLFLLIVIICFLIWRFERWKHRAIRYYSYAFLGCSLSGIFLFSFALIVRPYKSIGIEPKFLSALISSSLTSYLLTVLITFIVVGILTIEFYPIYKKLFKQVS
ncbi:MAG: hypothetical protein K0R90_1844 [Oscillospiraceae bacterium]|nr:hypothetical protein [Oscillospiraceae bacterium]